MSNLTYTSFTSYSSILNTETTVHIKFLCFLFLVQLLSIHLIHVPYSFRINIPTQFKSAYVINQEVGKKSGRTDLTPYELGYLNITEPSSEIFSIQSVLFHNYLFVPELKVT